MVEIEEGTSGGPTYWVTLRGETEAKALCYRKSRHKDKSDSGKQYYCANVAGHETWHRGEGACKYHGGTAGKPPTTGAKSVVAKRRLADDIQKYLEKDESKMMDLRYELAAVRILFQEFVEKFPDVDDERYGIEVNRAMAMVGTIGSLVDKISRIEARNTLTASQVVYLRVTVADILMKYIMDPDRRDRAIRELVHRVGGEGSEVRLIEGELA
jgi:hypothetical protein